MGLKVREPPFEIRAIPIWHIIIFPIVSFYVMIGVYAAFRNLAGWILLMAFAGPLFFGFFLSIVFSKIKVDKDGVMFRMYYVGFDEISRIRLRWGGRLMTYGKKLDLGYIMLNPEKFVEAVRAVKPEALTEYRKPIRNWKPLIYSLILLSPMVVLAVTGYVLRSFGVVINPFAWALVWGVVVTFFITAWAYWLPPHKWRIRGLGRLGTSIVIGLMIGMPISLLMLTKLLL